MSRVCPHGRHIGVGQPCGLCPPERQEPPRPPGPGPLGLRRACVHDGAVLAESCRVLGSATVHGAAAVVAGRAEIGGGASVAGHVTGTALVHGSAVIGAGAEWTVGWGFTTGPPSEAGARVSGWADVWGRVRRRGRAGHVRGECR